MIKIIKWWEQCENAGSRKLKEIRHFSAQSGNDSRGYRKLMRMGTDGLMAFGSFQALCQCMASLSQDARKVGEMVNSDGSSLDLDDLADLTRVPSDLLSSSIEILIFIGWVERLEPLETQQSPAEIPPTPINLPLISQDSPKGEERREEEGREGKGKERKGKKESPAAPPLPHGPSFAEAWGRWAKHRSEIKKPLKPTMIEGQLKELAELTEGHAVVRINHTITMGWQGLRDPDEIPSSAKDSKSPDIGGRTMMSSKVSDISTSNLPDEDEPPI